MGMDELMRAANRAKVVDKVEDCTIPPYYRGYYCGEFGRCEYDKRMYEEIEDRFIFSELLGEIECFEEVRNKKQLLKGRYFLHYIESSGMKPVLPKGYKSCYRIFYGCKSTSLDLSDFDTSDVEDMHGMFHKCDSLIKLDLSKLNTSKVTDMGYMFAGCNSLTSLDLTNFDTSNVINMANMFSWSENLTTIDMSSFDMSKVVDINRIFFDCRFLNELHLPAFDVSKLKDTSRMLDGCGLVVSHNNLGDKEILKQFIGQTKQV